MTRLLIFSFYELHLNQKKRSWVAENFDFAEEKLDFPVEKLDFPVEKMIFPVEKFDFPVEKHNLAKFSRILHFALFFHPFQVSFLKHLISISRASF